MILLSAMVSIISCKSDQDEKKAPIENTPDSTQKNDTSAVKKTDVDAPAKVTNNIKDSATTIAKTKNVEKKIKENKAMRHDSVSGAKNIKTSVAKKDNTTTPADGNQSATKPASADAGPVPFKSKYGTIPRDANQTNFIVFFNTFPDKSTRIRVNFDGPADAEMNNVKTQIIAVLKKSGYTNVEDKSSTIEPQRMPKEIHYELQHDGSVVFWVPIANQEQ